MKTLRVIVKTPIEAYMLATILEAFKADEETGNIVIIESENSELKISIDTEL